MALSKRNKKTKVAVAAVNSPETKVRDIDAVNTSVPETAATELETKNEKQAFHSSFEPLGATQMGLNACGIKSKNEKVEAVKTVASKSEVTEDAETKVEAATNVEAKEKKKANDMKTDNKKTEKPAGSIALCFEIQYDDKAVKEEDIVKMAKQDWADKKTAGHDEIKKLDIYFKPEENHVYYVVNGSETGDFSL